MAALKLVLLELKNLTRSERLFILFAMLCSFCISGEYAITRPVSNAVFLTAYGAEVFPWAWIAVVPLNFLLVALYNKYLPRLGALKTFLTLVLCIVTINLAASFFLQDLAWLPFFFYVWKEVYIMLMFQQLWSVIHSVVPFARAKILYGILFGCGALGSMTCSLLPGFCAVRMGSESLLLATLPLYTLLAIFYRLALKQTADGVNFKVEDATQRTSSGAFWHGFQLIRSSKLLTFILLIVLAMQLSSSLIDYQFNSYLQQNIPLKDLRTQFTGRTLGIVHTATLLLQFVGSFLFVHFLGMRRSHFFIPLVLSANALAFLSMPLFGMITFSYITVKSFDFSLFGVIKEMMYIPLKRDEKFRAKAFIDVFAYRSSKALASVLILGLQWALGAALAPMLSIATLVIFMFWGLAVHKMLKAEPVTV